MEPEDFEIGPFAQAVEIYSLKASADKYNKTPVMSLFSVGDIVKLKTGDAPQRVLETRWCKVRRVYTIRCEYLKSNKQLPFRPVSDYELYKPKTEPETIKEDPMKGKLFKTLDGTVYGEGLVIDGDGKYVLKLNNGDYKAFNAAELKRVMPFTFDVVFNGMSNKTYSYLGRAGSVEVGDILMDSKDFTIARVVAVGTESDAATKTFEGVKLVTAALA
jgi:hypothetical protein